MTPPLRCIIDHARGATVCGRRPGRDGIVRGVAADPKDCTCPRCRRRARHLFPRRPARVITPDSGDRT